MYTNDSLHHRLRPTSQTRRPWDLVGQNQFSSSGGSGDSGRDSSRRVRCHTSTVLITLTIITTGLAAYLITVIAKTPKSRQGWAAEQSGQLLMNTSPAKGPIVKADFEDDDELQSSENLPKAQEPKYSSSPVWPNEEGNGRKEKVVHNQEAVATAATSKEHRRTVDVKSKRSIGIGAPAAEPLSLMSSDIVATRVKPATELHTSENLKRIKNKLAHVSRADLIKLLALIQERINKSLKKRQIQNEITPSESSKAVAPVLAATAAAAAASKQTNATTTSSKTEVVLRSRRMEQLMSFLDKIEASMPQINETALERLSALDDERSVVRVIKPDLLSKVMQANSSSSLDAKLSQEQPISTSDVIKLSAIESPPAAWREPIESVAPDADWQPEQQQQTIEDWPAPQTTAEPVTTQRPRKKKKKRIRTTTTSTTTTSTTTTTPAPETTTSAPASTTVPPTPFEEIWIEEEEDIVRPPKRKTKKYKKKTSQAPATTTTSTTTTTTTSTTTTSTTTTTPAPVTTSTTTTQQPAVIVEDWPEEQWPEEQWPQQQEPASSTKAPALWPEQPQSQPQAPEEEHQKWPEEDWLNALRDDIENRLHIVYA